MQMMLAKLALPKTLYAETDVQLQSCEDVPCAPTLCFFPNRGIEVFSITSYIFVNMKSHDLPLAQKYKLFPGSQLPVSCLLKHTCNTLEAGTRLPPIRLSWLFLHEFLLHLAPFFACLGSIL
jgi:hypothetical protein